VYKKEQRQSKKGYPDLSNTMYLSRLTMMFLSCFHVFLCERFGLGLGSGLSLGLGRSCLFAQPLLKI